MENNTIATYTKELKISKLVLKLISKTLILRVGYAKYGSPYVENDFSIEILSYGIGME